MNFAFYLHYSINSASLFCQALCKVHSPRATVVAEWVAPAECEKLNSARARQGERCCEYQLSTCSTSTGLFIRTRILFFPLSFHHHRRVIFAVAARMYNVVLYFIILLHWRRCCVSRRILHSIVENFETVSFLLRFFFFSLHSYLVLRIAEFLTFGSRVSRQCVRAHRRVAAKSHFVWMCGTTAGLYVCD